MPDQKMEKFVPLEEIPLDGETSDGVAEKVNALVKTVNSLGADRDGLLKRLETAESALMRTIQKFEAHTHDKLGRAVIPVQS